MKISYNWLREFVDVSLDAQALADKLSLSGLEVAGVESAVPVFDGIVVAEITAIKDHPEADKLRICEVDAGQGDTLQIVCGAPNAHQGMKAPLAMLGGKLPDGTKIKKAKLRGVESSGMLCSVRELKLGESHEGLMALPADAPVGQPLQDYLGGNDAMIDIEITPNRGDCLSMLGVARDVGALVNSELREPATTAVKSVHQDVVKSELLAPAACPLFASRIIRGIDPAAQSPLWLRERLRRAGIKPISPVVDVTQYVMLELGQPLHAYDHSKLKGAITVRLANKGEKLTLLNNDSVSLSDDMLVIADEQQALGLAGIMGGADSAVGDDTTDILLESAWFAPEAINGRSRRLGLQTDAGYRFERGVVPGRQTQAIERATALLLDIVGGRPGPVDSALDKGNLPQRKSIKLRAQRLAAILGIDIPAANVEQILQALGMDSKAVPTATGKGWQVQAPAHRFDIAIEADLIEEVGRIYGYDKIPALQYASAKPMESLPETRTSLADIRSALVQRGYQEAITYSFVDADIQTWLMGEAGLALANPITSDMTHMRMSLWPGLLGALRYNANRQQERVRLFETGLRFIPQATEISQENVVSGLVSGPLLPLQWGEKPRAADFSTLKNDVESLFAGQLEAARFAVASHPALHPGQSAQVLLHDKPIGWLGALHPLLAKKLVVPNDTLLFEIAIQPLTEANVPVFEPISAYPAIRRDLAVIVDESVPAGSLMASVEQEAGELLRNVAVFDVYQGKNIDLGRKSVALALILQQSSRTLTDDEADGIMAAVANRLRKEYKAELRE